MKKILTASLFAMTVASLHADYNQSKSNYNYPQSSYGSQGNYSQGNYGYSQGQYDQNYGAPQGQYDQNYGTPQGQYGQGYGAQGQYGQTTQGYNQGYNQTPGKAVDMYQTNDDINLGRKVRDLLLKNLSGRAERVTVEIDHGNVTLKGFVDSSNEKDNIEAAIKKIDGVRNVNSQLSVRQGGDNYNPQSKSSAPTTR